MLPHYPWQFRRARTPGDTAKPIGKWDIFVPEPGAPPAARMHVKGPWPREVMLGRTVRGPRHTWQAVPADGCWPVEFAGRQPWYDAVQYLIIHFGEHAARYTPLQQHDRHPDSARAGRPPQLPLVPETPATAPFRLPDEAAGAVSFYDEG